MSTDHMLASCSVNQLSFDEICFKVHRSHCDSQNLCKTLFQKDSVDAMVQMFLQSNITDLHNFTLLSLKEP